MGEAEFAKNLAAEPTEEDAELIEEAVVDSTISELNF